MSNLVQGCDNAGHKEIRRELPSFIHFCETVREKSGMILTCQIRKPKEMEQEHLNNIHQAVLDQDYQV